MSQSRLTQEERSVLRSIFADLQVLFQKEGMPAKEVDEIVELLTSDEVKSYIKSLKESKPETALREAFFAGRSILKKYLFGEATPEAVVGDGFIDYKVRLAGNKIVLVELKPLFEAETERVKAGRELKRLRQKPLKPEKHKDQILKYIREGGEYIVLTNLKDWIFFSRSVTATEFEPFASVSLMDFHKEFEVERNLWDYLTRLDQQSIREDLDKRFFQSLKTWVDKLAEVEFTENEDTKTELIINLINKFIFIQTLDDYRIIEPRWIQKRWTRNERDWGSKGKEKVISEFFKQVDSWFYQYYDTELFRDKLLNYVKKDKSNFDRLHKSLGLVLGLEYWMSALGGFRGILQYNFRHIDEDILGKAYETYLAGVRHDEGIYYTPKFVTRYVAENTVGETLDQIITEVKEKLEEGNFEEVKSLLSEFTSVRVLDPACGSGSFLIKAVRVIMDKYRKIRGLLQGIERKHNKYMGSLQRPSDVEETVEKIHQAMNVLGPNNERELISRILVRHIHGNDKDKKALDVAKVNIWLEAIKLAPREFRYDRLPEDTNYILPDLEMNLCNGDSVLGLPEDLTVEYLNKEHRKEIAQMSNVRKEYMADPSKPELVAKITQIKRALRKELDNKFLDYLRKSNLPEEIIAETLPFHWSLGFWYLYFDEKGKPLPQDQRGSNFVIGNPPYERIQILNKKAPTYVQYLSNCGFISAFRNYDLAVIFIEKGFSLLKTNGVFGYIVTNKFMQADYGEALRGYLAERKCVKQLVNFGDEQVFEDATTYTMLLFLHKKEIESFKWALIKKLERTIEQLHKVSERKKFEDEASLLGIQSEETLSEQPWFFARTIEEQILDKLKNYPQLGDDDTSRIFVGLQTSADPVYILNVENRKVALTEVYSRAKKKSYVLESELLKPLVMGKEIKRWVVQDFSRLILFPYRIEGNRAVLINEETMETKYPRCWRYLLENKEYLEKRDRGAWKGRSDWYAFGRHQNIEKFEQQKIMTQVLASRSAFSLDPDGFFYFVGGGNAGGYGVLSRHSELSLEYLCGLLNSLLLDWHLKKRSSRFRGGFYSYAKRYAGKLPILLPKEPEDKTRANSIEQLVGRIIETKRAMYKLISLWQEWSVKLKGNEYTLEKILLGDAERIKQGQFKRGWTLKATFYPDTKQGILRKSFSDFRIVGEKEYLTLKLFGLDEANKEELVYEMEFNNDLLLSHIYLSILTLFDSRKKVETLKHLFSKTEVPVITPNVLESTSNIVKKVRQELASWMEEEAVKNVPANIIEIDNAVNNAEARIDSLVFKLYGLNKEEISTVMRSLSVRPSYQGKVLHKFDTG